MPPRDHAFTRSRAALQRALETIDDPLADEDIDIDVELEFDVDEPWVGEERASRAPTPAWTAADIEELERLASLWLASSAWWGLELLAERRVEADNLPLPLVSKRFRISTGVGGEELFEDPSPSRPRYRKRAAVIAALLATPLAVLAGYVGIEVSKQVLEERPELRSEISRYISTASQALRF